MQNKLSSLLKKVFFGSLAGIATSNTIAANNKTIELDSYEDDNNVESLLQKKIDLSPKLLLKKNNNNELAFMAHRSHRSHSSHRSHYSSNSGGSYTPPSNPERSNTPQNNLLEDYIPPSKNQGLSPGPKNKPILELGSRTLKKNMSGTDVTELVNILIRKEYLKLDGEGTIATGTYTYDEIVEDAVKKFQSANGLPSDGICGQSTIYTLKKK